MIRLVPHESPKPLSIGDARDAAKAAFAEAQKAQVELASNLTMTAALCYPGTVGYWRLKAWRNEARQQAERAQAVVDALDRALEAMERASDEERP